jgi:hypothetical protein
MNENSPFLRLSDDDDTVEDIEPLLEDGETEFQHTSSSSPSRKTSQRHQRLALGVAAFSALLFVFSVMFYGVYHFLGLVVTDRACLRIMSAYSELLLFAGNLLLLLSHIPRFLVILTRAQVRQNLRLATRWSRTMPRMKIRMWASLLWSWKRLGRSFGTVCIHPITGLIRPRYQLIAILPAANECYY